MKKVLIFFIILFVLFIVLIPFALLFSSKAPLPAIPFFSFPTPSPVLPPGTLFVYKAPQIVSSSPSAGEQNVSTSPTITIVFNRSVTNDEITFWVGPSSTPTVSITGNTLTATVSSPLSQGSQYGYSIKYKDGSSSKTYFFTTQGSGPINNSLYDPFSQMTTSQDKQLHPDIYISNQMPHTGNLFRVSYSYTPSPNSHIYFSVLLFGNDDTQAKSEFISWMKSAGLTDDQINGMDIRYKHPSGTM